jgi:mono/diheme cytochrome c family protein
MHFHRCFAAPFGLLMLALVNVSAQDQTRIYAIWGNPNDGRKVYAAKGCGRCHAINGVGPTIGPDLGRSPARPQTITQLAGAMWNHAPEMRKLAQDKGIRWTAFKESELRDLIAYLYFLRMLDQPGDVGRGEGLFDEKRCSTCHAVAGRGGRIASDLGQWKQYGSPILWAEIMWRHAVQMEAKMRDLGLAWPQFKDNEMGDLIAFIQSRVGAR